MDWTYCLYLNTKKKKKKCLLCNRDFSSANVMPLFPEVFISTDITGAHYLACPRFCPKPGSTVITQASCVSLGNDTGDAMCLQPTAWPPLKWPGPGTAPISSSSTGLGLSPLPVLPSGLLGAAQGAPNLCKVVMDGRMDRAHSLCSLISLGNWLPTRHALDSALSGLHDASGIDREGPDVDFVCN